MISFVIPARNEEACIANTLQAVKTAAEKLERRFEVIVVDDASTDRTGAIAEASGARVICVEQHHISAVRNAGGRQAEGTLLIFVDADTRPSLAAVEAAVAAIESGAIGGGCPFCFDDSAPAWARPLVKAGTWIAGRCGFVGGCFLFCTRDAFDRIGGFSEDHFAAEEFVFMKRLRQLGRVVIPPVAVETSGRKLQHRMPWDSFAVLLKLLAFGPEAFGHRSDYWYSR